MNGLRLPAEWEKHAFTQITWPGANTDWDYMLPQAQKCYVGIVEAIAKYEPLLIVTDDRAMVEKTIDISRFNNVYVIEMPINDTWARDHGFITLVGTDGAHLVDFQFNGWGMKFAAAADNQINRRLFDSVLHSNVYHSALRTVLEGGSIESDGRNTILTSSPCLLAPNRNCYQTKEEAETDLKSVFKGYRFLWVDNGELDGDDTDGHIDTLARMAPNDTIVYVRCADEADSHYKELALMEQQIKAFRTEAGQPYRLVALPMTPPIFDEECGERLPATYANFYFVNGAILMPTYGVASDAEALAIMAEAFPNFDIVGVDSRALIRQHGSLHCSTMQFPECVKYNFSGLK